MVYFISFDNKDLQYITTDCGHCWQLDLSATAKNQHEPPIGLLSHYQSVIIVTKPVILQGAVSSFLSSLNQSSPQIHKDGHDQCDKLATVGVTRDSSEFRAWSRF